MVNEEFNFRVKSKICHDLKALESIVGMAQLKTSLTPLASLA